jgi:hypothetical protein
MPIQRLDNGPVALPVPRGLSCATVDDEVLGALGDFLVEIVHQHAHRSFLLPSFAGKLDAPRRSHGTILAWDAGLICLCCWAGFSHAASPEQILAQRLAKRKGRRGSRVVSGVHSVAGRGLGNAFDPDVLQPHADHVPTTNNPQLTTDHRCSSSARMTLRG